MPVKRLTTAPIDQCGPRRKGIPDPKTRNKNPRHRALRDQASIVSDFGADSWSVS
jgi:hypothetical protein